MKSNRYRRSIAFIVRYIRWESAKSRALRANVTYVLTCLMYLMCLTCQRAICVNMPYMSMCHMCQRALCIYVPNVPSVSTCYTCQCILCIMCHPWQCVLHVNVSYVSTCLMFHRCHCAICVNMLTASLITLLVIILSVPKFYGFGRWENNILLAASTIYVELQDGSRQFVVMCNNTPFMVSLSPCMRINYFVLSSFSSAGS